MSYGEMYNRLHGMVPKIPIDLCKTLINDAWRDVRRKNLWSFLLYEGNWITPLQLNGGYFACTQGSDTVVADATATAVLAAASLLLPTPITQRQFRTGISTIYNIRAFDGTSTLTLDRVYAEPDGSKTWSIYQCYFPAPVLDHLTWIDVRDMVNFTSLFTKRHTRQSLDDTDPQRTFYRIPTDVIYYQQDQYASSPTYRFPLFELWGHPLFNLVYQLYGIRRGVDFASDTDTVPPAIGEDMILEQAKVYAYEWAEANKGDTPRNQGSDYKFLMGKATARYKELYTQYRKDDRETCNNFFSVRKISLYSKIYSYYSTLSGTAYPGVSF